MKLKECVLALPLAALVMLPHPVLGQAGKVMSEKEVTESKLIEALTPEPVPDDGGPRSRSIRVRRENGPGGLSAAPVAPAKTASASLLITFKTNSAELTPHAKQSLDVVGQALNSDKLADFRFEVEGHADPRGDPEANLELSRQRAESVRQYLIQQARVEDRRLEAVGKGDRELLNRANPIAPENRRVTIVNLSQWACAKDDGMAPCA